MVYCIQYFTTQQTTDNRPQQNHKGIGSPLYFSYDCGMHFLKRNGSLGQCLMVLNSGATAKPYLSSVTLLKN